MGVWFEQVWAKISVLLWFFHLWLSRDSLMVLPFCLIPQFFFTYWSVPLLSAGKFLPMLSSLPECTPVQPGNPNLIQIPVFVVSMPTPQLRTACREKLHSSCWSHRIFPGINFICIRSTKQRHGSEKQSSGTIYENEPPTSSWALIKTASATLFYLFFDSHPPFSAWTRSSPIFQCCCGVSDQSTEIKKLMSELVQALRVLLPAGNICCSPGCIPS